jgi:hypothetical protein
MERSIYPNGVLVTQTDLQRTEITKANQIKQSRVDETSRGLVSGGNITVNHDNNNRINVSAFSGYVPNGEFISTDKGVSSIPLADNNAGVVNIVCALYTEIPTKFLPTDVGNNIKATAIDSSFQVLVYTENDFNDPMILRPSDTNISNPAKDRCLILGKVTATGGALTLDDIEGATHFSKSLYANPTTPNNMDGIDILNIGDGTNTGKGSIEYDYDGDFKIRWASPGSSFGPQTVWDKDATKTVTDNDGKSITVRMNISQMGKDYSFPFVSDVSIIDLYSQDVIRFTAEDVLHRSMRGTGIVTPTNPHGISPDDIYGETISQLDEHQDKLHCNGIWRSSHKDFLKCSVISGSPHDQIFVTGPLQSDTYYVNGKRLNQITNQYIGLSNIEPKTHLCQIYVNDNGNIVNHVRATYPTLPRGCTGTWIVDCSKSLKSGSFDLKMKVKNSSPDYYYTFSWDNGQEVNKKLGDPDSVIRLFSVNGIDWVDLYVRTSVQGSHDNQLPVMEGTHLDSIEVSSGLPKENALLLGSYPYWYDANAMRGYAGWPSFEMQRNCVDLREWGNICESNLSDELIENVIAKPWKEFNFSGVVLDSDIVSEDNHVNVEGTIVDANTGNFKIFVDNSLDKLDVSGGTCYCGGRRLKVDGVFGEVFSKNYTYIVYVDLEGKIKLLNVTTNFLDIDVAFSYLVGLGVNRDTNSNNYHGTVDSSIGAGTYGFSLNQERGVPLYLLEPNSNNTVMNFSSIMRNVNSVTHEWSVGLFNASFKDFKAAFIHAKHWSKYSSVEVLVTGTVNLKETVVQPGKVSVRGLLGNEVLVRHNADRNWHFSSSLGFTFSIVGVNFKWVGGSTPPTDYQMFSYHMGGLVLRDCSFDLNYIKLFNPAKYNTINDVYIEKCTFSATSLVGGGPDCIVNNFNISDCTFFDIKESVMSRCSLNESSIVGNRFFINGYSQYLKLIEVSGSSFYVSGFNFSRNTVDVIYTTSNNDGKILKLLNFKDVNYFGDVTFSNNTFRKSDSSRLDYQAIIVEGCSVQNLKVINNTFKDVLYGVVISSDKDASIKGAVIDYNTFLGVVRGAVFIVSRYSRRYPVTIENLSISDNEINSLSTLVSDYYVGNTSGNDGNYGIYVFADHTVGSQGSVNNFKISNNIFKDVNTIEGDDPFNCIRVKLIKATGSNGEINGNKFSNITHTSSLGGEASVISCSVSGSGVYAKICDNEAVSVNYEGIESSNYFIRIVVDHHSNILVQGNKLSGFKGSLFPFAGDPTNVSAVSVKSSKVTVASTVTVCDNFLDVSRDFLDKVGVWTSRMSVIYIDGPLSNLNISNNALTLSKGPTSSSSDYKNTYGIYVDFTGDYLLGSGNFSSKILSTIISNNKVYSYYSGIYYNGDNHSMQDGGTVGNKFVNQGESLTLTGNNVTSYLRCVEVERNFKSNISDNSLKLLPRGGDLYSENLFGSYNSCMYVSSHILKIKGNTTGTLYPVTSINGGTSFDTGAQVFHIFVKVLSMNLRSISQANHHHYVEISGNTLDGLSQKVIEHDVNPPQPSYTLSGLIVSSRKYADNGKKRGIVLIDGNSFVGFKRVNWVGGTPPVASSGVPISDYMPVALIICGDGLDADVETNEKVVMSNNMFSSATSPGGDQEPSILVSTTTVSNTSNYDVGKGFF